MGIFSRAPSMFYSIFLNNDTCKIYFRELGFQKSVVREAQERISLKNESDLSEKISTFFRQTDKKKGFVSLLVTSQNQGLIKEGSEIDEQEFITQKIDDGITAYISKTDINDIKDRVVTDVSEYMSPFKMLYFLYKNQDFNATSLFALKFDDSAALIIANQEEVLFSKMIGVSDEISDLMNDSGLDFEVDDIDEIFYQILRNNIVKFYKNSDEFIENIFIYDEESISSEMGYYIFTRIFIKTNVVPINIADFMNKINIKENI